MCKNVVQEESDLKLKQFCRVKSKHIATRSIERYSFGSEIRKYLNIPKFIPLYIYSNHGVYLWSEPHQTELDTKYYGVLLFTEDLKKEWERKLKIRKLIQTIPHPYLLYQRRTKYKLGVNRRGSLFFFSHSTWDTEIETNYELIKERLDTLDESFKPVRIVLHFIDVLKGKGRNFNKMGYEVISFGNMYNTLFVENLYNTLKNTRYALSNIVGSHTFYCINAGIPFSLIDTGTTLKQPDREVNYNKRANRNLQKVEELTKLIGTRLNYNNSQMTIDFVNTELGINNPSSKIPLIYFIIESNLIYAIAKIRAKIIRYFS